jgi:hypothetical protein
MKQQALAVTCQHASQDAKFNNPAAMHEGVTGSAELWLLQHVCWKLSLQTNNKKCNCCVSVEVLDMAQLHLMRASCSACCVGMMSAD